VEMMHSFGQTELIEKGSPKFHLPELY
jgi:hypothetical protein